MKSGIFETGSKYPKSDIEHRKCNVRFGGIEISFWSDVDRMLIGFWSDFDRNWLDCWNGMREMVRIRVPLRKTLRRSAMGDPLGHRVSMSLFTKWWASPTLMDACWRIFWSQKSILITAPTTTTSSLGVVRPGTQLPTQSLTHSLTGPKIRAEYPIRSDRCWR